MTPTSATLCRADAATDRPTVLVPGAGWRPSGGRGKPRPCSTSLRPNSSSRARLLANDVRANRDNDHGTNEPADRSPITRPHRPPLVTESGGFGFRPWHHPRTGGVQAVFLAPPVGRIGDTCPRNPSPESSLGGAPVAPDQSGTRAAAHPVEMRRRYGSNGVDTWSAAGICAGGSACTAVPPGSVLADARARRSILLRLA